MTFRWTVGVVVLLAVTAGGVAAPATAVQQDAPDAVLMHVDLAPGGDAGWRIEYRYRLGDEQSEAAFESLRSDVRNDTTTYRQRFADRMRPTLRDAENATGREMALENVTVSTRRVQLPQAYGVVSYRFEWTNFAVVDGDRVRAGDALAGLFLADDTALVFAWPEGHHAAAVDPAPDERDDRSVRWTGPVEFGDGEPRLALAPGTPTPGAASPTPGEGTPAGGDDGDTGGSGLAPPGLLLSGAFVAGVFAVGTLFAVRRARRDHDDGAGPGSDAGPTDEDAAPAPDLLTNEEQVLGLLEERGGRVKQQTVAAELGWTDAKTSKVVRGLREEGAVEVVRLGRENVVGLPGELDT